MSVERRIEKIAEHYHLKVREEVGFEEAEKLSELLKDFDASLVKGEKGKWFVVMPAGKFVRLVDIMRMGY